MADRPTLAGKSVLVLGGAGFIGSHLVDRIVDERPRRVWRRRQPVPRPGGEPRRRPASGFPTFASTGWTRPTMRRWRASWATTRPTSSSTSRWCPLPASLEQPRWSVEHNVAWRPSPASCCARALRDAHPLLFVRGLRLGGLRADGRGPPAGPVDAVRSEQAGRRPRRPLLPAHLRASTPRSSGPSTTSGRARMPARTPGSSRSSSSRATSRASRSRSSATASRPATSSSSATPPTPRSGSTRSQPPGDASSTSRAGERSSVNDLVRVAARRPRLRRRRHHVDRGRATSGATGPRSISRAS